MIPMVFEHMRVLGVTSPAVSFRELKDALECDHEEDCVISLVVAHTSLGVKIKKMIPLMILASRPESAELLKDRICLHEEFALTLREYAELLHSPASSPVEKCGKWAA